MPACRATPGGESMMGVSSAGTTTQEIRSLAGSAREDCEERHRAMAKAQRVKASFCIAGVLLLPPRETNRRSPRCDLAMTARRIPGKRALRTATDRLWFRQI